MSDGTASGDGPDSSDPSACGAICPDLRSPTTWGETLADWTRDEAILKLADVPAADNERLAAFMRCLYKHCQDRERLPGIDGSGSVFQSRVRLADKEFTGPIHFDGARFNSGADFSGSRFDEVVNFRKAVFADVADFTRCGFGKDSGFDGASFDIGDFRSARFGGDRSFDGTVRRTALHPDWNDLELPVWIIIAAALGIALVGLLFGNFTGRAVLLYVLACVAAGSAAFLYLLGQRMGCSSPAWPGRTTLVPALTIGLATLAVVLALAGLVADLQLQPENESGSSSTEPPPPDKGSDTAITADEPIPEEWPVVGPDGAGCVVLDSNGNPIVGSLTVELGGLWLTTPQPITDQPATNAAGQSLLGEIIENLVQPGTLKEIRELSESATGAATDGLTDNIDGLLDKIVGPIVEGLVASGDSDDATAVLGPDIEQRLLVQIGEQSRTRTMSD